MSEQIHQTVRCPLVDSAGNVLVLRKGPSSKIAGRYEFAGGKIDLQKLAFLPLVQMIASEREVFEETRLKVFIFKFRRIFQHAYTHFYKNSIRKVNVHTLIASVSGIKPDVLVDQTLDEDGNSEDKHDAYEWLSKEELTEMAQKPERNIFTGKKEILLAKNSRASVDEILKYIQGRENVRNNIRRKLHLIKKFLHQ